MNIELNSCLHNTFSYIFNKHSQLLRLLIKGLFFLLINTFMLIWGWHHLNIFSIICFALPRLTFSLKFRVTVTERRNPELEVRNSFFFLPLKYNFRWERWMGLNVWAEMAGTPTEDGSRLLHNLLQLLLAPAGHGPLQSPAWPFRHSPGHLLHHKLPGEAGRSKDDQVVRAAGSRFKASHDRRKATGRWLLEGGCCSGSSRRTETSGARGGFDGASRYFRSSNTLIGQDSVTPFGILWRRCVVFLLLFMWTIKRTSVTDMKFNIS